MHPVLIIEDEAALAAALGQFIQRFQMHPILCASAAMGLQKLNQTTPSLVILDIGLPDNNGLEVLNTIRLDHPDLPVLIITAHGNLHNAVEARKRGASAYLVKPLDLHELQQTLHSILPSPTTLPPATTTALSELPQLVGNSPAMQPAFAAIAHAISSSSPVLITGPTGIGKSLAAKVIHHHSPRQQQPFITLSCASLPETLLEAELFGHEKGAFTGALTTKTGHLERAAGGTLFLDEIAEIPLSIQVKLLRFVEEKTFTRVGGRDDLSVDLRLIAATNQNLNRAVAEKRFREDLYYRLRVLEVPLPPLADRLGDLPILCQNLLHHISPHRPITLTAETLTLLKNHPWPGNVRELRNVLEYAVSTSTSNILHPAHLPRELRHPLPPSSDLIDQALHQWLDTRLTANNDNSDPASYDSLHDELENRLLAALLPRYEHKPTLLARALQMNRATLRKKLALNSTDAD
ncbi:sigma-54-dependent Fis family transcriptional regulator [Phragmitibacter flavus]|uniref:Sigma-54-dependent Fis family transcriptional regulator n=1 Tax=Phragmitibacter flavus TaxID=2576071 RepID=A0A5R8KJ60_9BACT|nr:sigma-54 dependent transcriptional regulator [Phragmitibacter flavus]TLD72287.1 sigma-54-dependent Fis family transcriptional regulator [Phragmitibacter flavus]